MGLSTVLIIAMAAGVLLVVGGGLMVYMGNLVRAAYEIKVQINNDVEERLTKMGDDLDKKSRWIKRDLLEEIEKIKVAMQTDNARKIGELSAPLIKQLESLEALIRNERAELTKAIDTDRQVIASLDQRIRVLQRQTDKKVAAPEPEQEPGTSNALDEAATILAARSSVNTTIPAVEPSPPEAPAPAAPAKPASMMAGLPDLGRSGA